MIPAKHQRKAAEYEGTQQDLPVYKQGACIWGYSKELALGLSNLCMK